MPTAARAALHRASADLPASSADLPLPLCPCCSKVGELDGNLERLKERAAKLTKAG